MAEDAGFGGARSSRGASGHGDKFNHRAAPFSLQVNWKSAEDQIAAGIDAPFVFRKRLAVERELVDAGGLQPAQLECLPAFTLTKPESHEHAFLHVDAGILQRHPTRGIFARHRRGREMVNVRVLDNSADALVEAYVDRRAPCRCPARQQDQMTRACRHCNRS